MPDRRIRWNRPKDHHAAGQGANQVTNRVDGRQYSFENAPGEAPDHAQLAGTQQYDDRPETDGFKPCGRVQLQV